MPTKAAAARLAGEFTDAAPLKADGEATAVRLGEWTEVAVVEAP